MAFQEKIVSLGTTDTLLFECPVTLSGSAHGIVFSNITATPQPITFKHYCKSSGITQTLAQGRVVPANGEIAWPKPINLAAGDQLIGVATGLNAVTALSSIYLAAAAPVSAGFMPRGEHSIIATYAINDVVSKGGSSYIAVAPNVNDPPPSSSWMLQAAKGEQGSDGADGVDGVTQTASSLGLGNVDNTSDADKPVSTATQTALASKANTDNPVFTGRIIGAFSDATVANRVMLQTSTVNSGTIVGTVALGTIPDYAASGFIAYADSDPLASQSVSAYCFKNLETRFSSNSSTGTHLPMTFYTGGAERMRIETDGTGIYSGGLFNITGLFSTHYYALAFNGRYLRKNSATDSIEIVNQANTGITHTFGDDGALTVNQPAGLGYGYGAGGTVTQATSKSTAVTLNTPTGQITMHNAAQAAGATVAFVVIDSVVTFTDVVNINHRNGADYNVWAFPGIGEFTVYLKNISGGSLSDAVVLNFAIIKGATA